MSNLCHFKCFQKNKGSTIYLYLQVKYVGATSSLSNDVSSTLMATWTKIQSRKRFMTQLCTLVWLLSHKNSANPIKNLVEPLPHLFRPEASCGDNSLGTGSLKPALERKQFASFLIFIHFNLTIWVSCICRILSF